jgi:hypothetical protein
MWFFSKFRTFSRLSVEFEERIAQLETRNAALRRDLAELDEFTHRIARKRYQDTYVPPGTPAEASPENGQPEANAAQPRVSAAKAAIWQRIKAVKHG